MQNEAKLTLIIIKIVISGKYAGGMKLDIVIPPFYFN